MARKERRKSVKIAGVTVYDKDIIAVLEGTAHLEPPNRKRVLYAAARLVEFDFFGFKPRVRRAPRLSLEISPEKTAPSRSLGIDARNDMTVR